MKYFNIVLLLLLSGCGPAKNTTETYKLTALRPKDSIAGSAFLGIGNVRYEPYYFYYIDEGGGKFVPQSLSAESSVLHKVTIYEEITQDATLIHRHCQFSFLGESCNGYTETDEYEFHVPIGTIIKGYNL